MVKPLPQQAQERLGLPTQTAPSTHLDCKKAVLMNEHALEILQNAAEDIFKHLYENFKQFTLNDPSQLSASNNSNNDNEPESDDKSTFFPSLASTKTFSPHSSSKSLAPLLRSLQPVPTDTQQTVKRPIETSHDLKQRMLANIQTQKLPSIDELQHYHTTYLTEQAEQAARPRFRSCGVSNLNISTSGFRSLSGISAIVATQVTTGNSLAALDNHKLSAVYEGLSAPYYQNHQTLTAQLEGALQQSTQLSYGYQGNSFATNPNLKDHYNPTYLSDIANANIGASLLGQKLETPYGMHTVAWQDAGNAQGQLFGSQFATDASMELRNSVTGEKNTLPFVAKGSVFERRSAPIDLSALTITTQDGHTNLLDFLSGDVTPDAIRLTPGAKSADTRYSISGPLLNKAQDAHPQTQISCCVLPKSSHGLEWNGTRYVYFNQHLLELVITPNGISSFLYDNNHRRQSFGPVDAHGKPSTFHIKPQPSKKDIPKQAEQAKTLNQVQQLIQSAAYQTFSSKLDAHHSNLHDSVKVELFIQACIPDPQLAKKLSQAYLQYQMELDTSQRMIDAHGMPTRSDICYSLLIPVTLTPNADGSVSIARQANKDTIVSLVGNIMTTFQPSADPMYTQAMDAAFFQKESLMGSTSMDHAYAQALDILPTLSQDSSLHTNAIQNEIKRHEKEVASVAPKVTEFFQELENRLQAPLTSATSVSLFDAVHKRMQTLCMQNANYQIPPQDKIHFHRDIHALYHACLWSQHTVLNSISSKPKQLADTIEMMQSVKPKHFPHCTLFNELLCNLCHLRIHQSRGFTHTAHDTEDRLSPPDTPIAVEDLSELLADIDITHTSIDDLLAERFQDACAVSKASFFHLPIGPSAPRASL